MLSRSHWLPLQRPGAAVLLGLLCLSLSSTRTAQAAEPGALNTPPASTTAPSPALTPPPPLSATAEQVFEQARPRLLQIRTLLIAAQKQSSIGSGFRVDADGFAMTNYHVVSQYALEPQTYQLEYLAPDGSRGPLQLHAIDIANDLAVVRLSAPATAPSAPNTTPQPYFTFNPTAVAGALQKGERLFAMGNPLDLGFTIVEGTYNGLVENSYQPRIHFTGALNPGMSGGPAVTTDSRIAGVNVAKQIGGDLVSFLVPASAAHTLFEKARANEAMSPADVREEIGRQLDTWQNGFFAALDKEGFRTVRFGPYQAAEVDAPWFNCWARTNSDARPKPRVLTNEASCDTRTALFLAGNMSSGQATLSHTYLKNVDLNAFQFASFLSRQSQPRSFFGGRRRFTAQQCYENFMTPDKNPPANDAALIAQAGEKTDAKKADGTSPTLRVTWCARAYRDFANLYDVSVTAITQESSQEALASRLMLTGVSYPNAVSFTQKFLNAIEVTR